MMFGGAVAEMEAPARRSPSDARRRGAASSARSIPRPGFALLDVLDAGRRQGGGARVPAGALGHRARTRRSPSATTGTTTRCWSRAGRGLVMGNADPRDAGARPARAAHQRRGRRRARHRAPRPRRPVKGWGARSAAPIQKSGGRDDSRPPQRPRGSYFFFFEAFFLAAFFFAGIEVIPPFSPGMDGRPLAHLSGLMRATHTSGRVGTPLWLVKGFFGAAAPPCSSVEQVRLWTGVEIA